MFCFIVFLRFCCGDAFCTDTLLQADDVTRRNVCKEQLLCANTLTQRGLSQRNFCTQTLLHTEPFTQRNLCTEQFLHNETLTREKFDTKNLSTQTAQRNFYTQNLYPDQLLHTHTHFFPHRNLYSQKFLCTTFFSQALLHTDAFTQKKYTQKLVHTARFYTQPAFTQRGFASLLDHLPFVFPLSSKSL